VHIQTNRYCYIFITIATDKRQIRCYIENVYSPFI